MSRIENSTLKEQLERLLKQMEEDDARRKAKEDSGEWAKKDDSDCVHKGGYRHKQVIN
jgi:hypothetical protein